MDEKQSITPFPGGMTNYVKTLSEMLLAIKENQFDKESLVQWMNMEYSSPSTAENCIRLINNIGLVDIRDGIFNVSSDGRSFLDTNDNSLILELFDKKKIFGFKEILRLLSEKKILHKSEIDEEIKKQYEKDWETDEQITFRLNWLLSLGFVNEDSRGYFLTEEGKSVSNKIKNTSIQDIKADEDRRNKAKWVEKTLNPTDVDYSVIGIDPKYYSSEFISSLPRYGTNFWLVDIRTGIRYYVYMNIKQYQISSLSKLYKDKEYKMKIGDKIGIAISPENKDEVWIDFEYKRPVIESWTQINPDNMGDDKQQLKLVPDNEIKKGSGIESIVPMAPPGEEIKTENNINIGKFIDKQGLACVIHKSIRDKREKDFNNDLDILDISAIVESISDTELNQIINKSIHYSKEKASKESQDRIRAEEKAKKDQENIRINAESIDRLEFIKKIQDAFHMAGFKFSKLQIINHLVCITAQQMLGHSGIPGTGKDTLTIGIEKLVCENYKEQVLEIPANKSLDVDDKPIIGYQHALKQKYQYPPFLWHIKKSLEDQERPYFIIIDEANVANPDSYLTSIVRAIESASRKITFTFYRDEDTKNGEFELIVPKNLFIVFTMNRYETRHRLSPMMLDRMNVIDFRDPNLRKSVDFKSTKNEELFEYKELSYDPIIAYLFNKYILNDNFRKMTVGEARYKDTNYRDWENQKNDIIVELLESINSELKKGHLIYEQCGPRTQDAILRYLYSSKYFCNDEKIMMDLQILQKVIPKIENVTDDYVDTLKNIRDLLSTSALLPPSEKSISIEKLNDIIWRVDPYGRNSKNSR